MSTNSRLERYHLPTSYNKLTISRTKIKFTRLNDIVIGFTEKIVDSLTHEFHKKFTKQ